jgi:hypothetical protein
VVDDCLHALSFRGRARLIARGRLLANERNLKPENLRAAGKPFSSRLPPPGRATYALCRCDSFNAHRQSVYDAERCERSVVVYRELVDGSAAGFGVEEVRAGR